MKGIEKTIVGCVKTQRDARERFCDAKKIKENKETKRLKPHNKMMSFLFFIFKKCYM